MTVVHSLHTVAVAPAVMELAVQLPEVSLSLELRVQAYRQSYTFWNSNIQSLQVLLKSRFPSNGQFFCLVHMLLHDSLSIGPAKPDPFSFVRLLHSGLLFRNLN